MMVTVYESLWFRMTATGVRAAIDPTRMAQGLMTGNGFLGAGVIMKEGLSVRGLTTAASIWVTAGIGILVGIGLYAPAAITTALALGALGGFRWIERRIRTESYAAIDMQFAAEDAPSQTAAVTLVSGFGFAVRDVSHRFARGPGPAVVAYGMRVHSLDPTSISRLSEALRARPDVLEFEVVPAGD
jgi:putative Mg2+ transporter-C (MgtC) family protein